MISVMVTPSLEVGGLLELGPGAVLDLAVVGPFDAAIAGRDVGRGQHHEAAAEPAGMRGLVGSSRAVWCSPSLTRTTTCGAATRGRQQAVGAVRRRINEAKKPTSATVTAAMAAMSAAPSDFRNSSSPCT